MATASGGSSPPLKRQRCDQEQGQTLIFHTEYHKLLTQETPALRTLIQMKPLRSCLCKHGVVNEPSMQLIEVSIWRKFAFYIISFLYDVA